MPVCTDMPHFNLFCFRHVPPIQHAIDGHSLTDYEIPSDFSYFFYVCNFTHNATDINHPKPLHTHTHTHTSLTRCVMKAWDPTPSFEYFLSFCSQWKPPSTAWEHCTSSYFLTCWNPCKKFTTSVVRQSLHKTLEGKTSNQTFSMQKCILCASAAHGATATGQ